MLIAVGGLSGTGKSLLARALAPRLRRSLARLCCAAMSSAKRCSASPRPTVCRRMPIHAEVTARVYATLAAKARRVLAAGHSAIVDAVFAEAGRTRSHRHKPHRARPSTASSSPPISPPASPASARARTTPPMPTPKSRAPRSNTTLGPLRLARSRCLGHAGGNTCSAPTPRSGCNALAMHLATHCPAALPPWRDGSKSRHSFAVGPFLSRPRRVPSMNAAPRFGFSARQLAVGLAGYCTFINLYSPQAILPLLASEFRRRRRPKSPPS